MYCLLQLVFVVAVDVTARPSTHIHSMQHLWQASFHQLSSACTETWQMEVLTSKLAACLHSCLTCLADDSWALGWALGQRFTADIQAHVVELACRPVSGTDLPAFRSAQAAAAEVQWATTTKCASGSIITAVGSPFGVMSPSISPMHVCMAWSATAGQLRGKATALC